ncbi:hypothetical protein A0J57_05405 [Sphingobium sp. 22B]|uniref:hypothetical protein n=1 Tax=unclassified Sphingobium TaxID=2611147 RepID=UPI0007805097|nr:MULTISPECIES: hypothetical protein [unclassified Sphingobium]KXU31547.1 hypothetical protein AXW74_11845 [Sphingobium sp. AM]KYC33545.1 hypothetical protein A0J57_05405 [Sphingobium sp. 22B]OAP32726.1 hypothetical protein A8O16_07525 [Sphingobium sp. 20006FA]
MTVARSIIIAALIVVLGVGVISWALMPRYSLTTIGQGASIRLDRLSGSMVGCRELACRVIVDRDQIKSEEWPGTNIPPPPPGFTIQNQN